MFTDKSSDDRIKRKYVHICEQLDINSSIVDSTWVNYLSIRNYHTLEGCEIQWLCCALHVNLTNESNKLSEISLEKLLGLCNIKMCEFLMKTEQWISMVNTSSECIERCKRLRTSLSVSKLTYKKYSSIFCEYFTSPDNSKEAALAATTKSTPQKNKKSKQANKCTPNNVYEFCWYLFLLVQGENQEYSIDIVKSFHMLLCCIDLIFANIAADKRDDLLNMKFGSAATAQSKDKKPADTEPVSIIKELCQQQQASEIVALEIKSHNWKESMQRFFRDNVLKGNSSTFLGILSAQNYDSNIKSIKGQYEAFIRRNGKIDVGIFLLQAPSENVTDPKTHSQIIKILAPLNASHNLPNREPINVIASPNAAQNVDRLHQHLNSSTSELNKKCGVDQVSDGNVIIFTERRSDEPIELSFKEVPENDVERSKRQEIEEALREPNTPLSKWKEFARSDYGFVGYDLRHRVWPKLIELNNSGPKHSEKKHSGPNIEYLKKHSKHVDVMENVERSLERIPPDFPDKQRNTLKGDLSALMLRVILEFPCLNEYEENYDVAIKFLLMLGEMEAFYAMEWFLRKQKETKELERYFVRFQQNREYELDLKKFEPWYLTWFNKSLNSYKSFCRLYDYLLASPPSMPLYILAYVLEKCGEISDLNCLGIDLSSDVFLKNVSKYFDKETKNKNGIWDKGLKKRVELESHKCDVRTKDDILPIVSHKQMHPQLSTIQYTSVLPPNKPNTPLNMPSSSQYVSNSPLFALPISQHTSTVIAHSSVIQQQQQQQLPPMPQNIASSILGIAQIQEPMIPSIVLDVQNKRLLNPSELSKPPEDLLNPAAKKQARSRKNITPIRDSLITFPPNVTVSPGRTQPSPLTITNISNVSKLYSPRPSQGQPFPSGQSPPQRYYAPNASMSSQSIPSTANLPGQRLPPLVPPHTGEHLSHPIHRSLQSIEHSTNSPQNFTGAYQNMPSAELNDTFDNENPASVTTLPKFDDKKKGLAELAKVGARNILSKKDKLIQRPS